MHFSWINSLEPPWYQIKFRILLNPYWPISKKKVSPLKRSFWNFLQENTQSALRMMKKVFSILVLGFRSLSKNAKTIIMIFKKKFKIAASYVQSVQDAGYLLNMGLKNAGFLLQAQTVYWFSSSFCFTVLGFFCPWFTVQCAGSGISQLLVSTKPGFVVCQFSPDLGT